jgi:hypothetical protein
VDIDIAGWRLTGGVEFTFPAGTKILATDISLSRQIPARQALSDSGHSGHGAGHCPMAASACGGQSRRAGDGCHRVQRRGRLAGWPRWLGGYAGATRNETAAAEPANWTTSADTGGTPGRKNFALPGQAPTVTTPSQLNSAWKYFVGTPGAAGSNPRSMIPHGFLRRRLYTRAPPLSAVEVTDCLDTGRSMKRVGQRPRTWARAAVRQPW